MNESEIGPPLRRRKLALSLVVLAVALGVGFAVWLAARPKPQALFTQGLARSHRDPVAAERLFRRAIDASQGQFPDAQLGVCLALARQGKWDDIRPLLREIDLSACRPRILLDFGREALEANRLEAARPPLDELALRNVHESSEAMELLIAGYRRSGLQNELLAVARELTKRSPDRFDIWRMEVEILRAMKLENECLETARAALKNDPPAEYRREFQYLVVEMLINRGDAAAAAVELKRLQNLEGDSFRAQACVASIFRLEGRFDEALKAAGALFSEPGHEGTARLIRGFVYLDRGEFPKAITDLKQAIAAQPYNTQAHFKLSEAYRAQGQTAEALTHSRIANELAAKRLQINSLLKQRAALSEPDRQLSLELSQLFEEIGDSAAAAHWLREAGDGQ